MPLAKSKTNPELGEYEIEEVPEGIPRDRWKRPLIVPPGGGKPVPYTRASTLGKAIEDTYHINRWEVRAVALGMSRREELVARAAAIPENEGEHREPLQGIATEAKTAGGGDKGANIGTALHKLAERADDGDDLSYLPSLLKEAIEAYLRCMADFEVLASETFVVCDPLQTAGSFDRVVHCKTDLAFHHAELKDVLLPAGTVLILDLKGLALDTPIPTPTGWTTMAAVQVDEQVIDSDGRPCTVTAKSRTKRIGTYIVTFDDGEKITCDNEHIWWVSGGGYSKADQRLRPVGIEEIRRSLRDPRGQAWWRVPVAESLDLPEQDLPIDPYLLGCWLGDGSAAGGVITKGRDLFEILVADGHELGAEQANHSGEVFTRTVLGLRTTLRTNAMLGTKAIPDAYLRGSAAQRTRLLQGLLDTDGTWNTARGRAVFNSTDKALALQVEELLLTLGQRPHLAEYNAHGFGKDVVSYAVEFLPVDLVPFRLPRKASKVGIVRGRTTGVRTTRARRRVIVSIEPGPDVETACIAVDSPNSTYLCGRHMVPTHNTGKAASADYWGPTYGVQQTVYACGEPYWPGKGADGRYGWEELCGAVPSDRWALILHVPGDKPQDAGLVVVDLEDGRAMSNLALDNRKARKSKTLLTNCFPVRKSIEDPTTAEDAEEPPADGSDMFGPGVIEDAVVTSVSNFEAANEVTEGEVVEDSRRELVEQLLDAILRAESEDELGALYDAAGEIWLDVHTAAVRARIEELKPAPVVAVPRQVLKAKLIAAIRTAESEQILDDIWTIGQEVWDEDATRMAKARLKELEAAG